jgi:hypothetical protein
MSDNQRELVVTLDGKRLLILGILSLFAMVTVGTYISALFAFKSPSQEFRFKGNVSTVKDYYFNVATSFSKGGTVRITGIVLSADQYFVPPTYYYSFTTTTSVKWIVTVKDPNDMPVHFAYGDLAGAGLSNHTLPEVSFVIPSDAASGTYKIRVMAWSGWLPGGDTLTFEVLEDTFTVT